jgi:hypothetical protein
VNREQLKTLPVLGNDINQCMMCAHLIKMGVPFMRGGQGWRCKAFGDRDIPDEIVMGFKDHRDQWTGFTDGNPDNGTLFKDRADLDYTYEDLAGPLADDEDDAEDEEDPAGDE